MRFAPSRLIRSKLIVKLTMTIVDRSIKIYQAIRNYILVSTTHLSNVIAMNIPTQLKMLQYVRIFLHFDWIRTLKSLVFPCPSNSLALLCLPVRWFFFLRKTKFLSKHTLNSNINLQQIHQIHLSLNFFKDLILLKIQLKRNLAQNLI